LLANKIATFHISHIIAHFLYLGDPAGFNQHPIKYILGILLHSSILLYTFVQ